MFIIYEKDWNDLYQKNFLIVFVYRKLNDKSRSFIELQK